MLLHRPSLEKTFHRFFQLSLIWKIHLLQHFSSPNVFCLIFYVLFETVKSILHSRPPLNEKGEWSGKVHPGDDVGFMWGPSGTTDACGMEVQLMAHNGKGVSQTKLFKMNHSIISMMLQIAMQDP